MRGEQLGRAAGGSPVPNCPTDAVREFDIVVVVKKIDQGRLASLHQMKKFIVWDVVDAWPQPLTGVDWDEKRSLEWLDSQLTVIRPNAVVAATERMAKDVRALRPGLPVKTIYHHGTPQGPAVLRTDVRVIGYTGAAHYLHSFIGPLTDWCNKNGAWIRINGDYQNYDIVLALRGNGGWPAAHWKSNVKLANAQASGIPCICSYESGYLETRSGGERFVDPKNVDVSLIQALDSLKPLDVRNSVRAEMLRNPPLLDSIASEYGTWLKSLKY